MRTQCPHCQALFNIRPEYVGKRTTCKNCTQGFIITEAPVYASQPDMPESTSLPQWEGGSPASAPTTPAAPSAITAAPAAAAPKASGYKPPPVKAQRPSSESPANEAEEDDEDDDDEDEEEEVVQTPPPSTLGGKIRARLSQTPRQTLRAGVALFLAGLILGGGLSWFVSQREVLRLEDELAAVDMEKASNKARRLIELKRERTRLNEEIMRATVTGQTYPDNSIPKALALAAMEEYKITDALLQQQIAALETGARVSLEVKQSSPDPGLASRLETEMSSLRDSIDELRAEAESLAEMPRLVAETAVATELINLAILNRNRLIAKYGLSSPIPSQYGGAGPVSKAEPESDKNAVLKEAEESRFKELAENRLKEATEQEKELKREIVRLKGENERIQNTENILYAAALSDFEAGKLASAGKKFEQMVRLFPQSSLTPQAQETLEKIRAATEAREAAKKLPVDLNMAALRHDGGYLRNETYVRISFRNISSLMIKKVEFKVLTFDEHGYPVPSKRMAVIKDNDLTAVMAENIPPGKFDYGMWELSEKVRQVKVKLQKVEFYDAEPWQENDIEAWVAKEGGRYAPDQVAAKK